MRAAAPTGRAERLGMAPPEPGASQAEALPSRIVHAGHRHRIGAEVAGSWRGRAAVVFDLDLATDYGGRGEDAGGVEKGRFHVAAIAVRESFGWWAMTRSDVREHLPNLGRGAHLPGTKRLEKVLMASDPGSLPSVPAPVIDWVGRDVAGRRIGRYPISALEVAGSWTLAVLPVAGMERSDEDAAALSARLGRPELAPWPEQLLGLLTDFGSRLEAPSRGAL